MKLVFLGDIAFLGKSSIKLNRNYKDYFRDVANYLRAADFVIGNLETPFSYKKKIYGTKSAFICADPQDAEILSYLNIGAVTLANNHMFDYGKEAYELTKKILEDRNIAYFGVEGKECLLDLQENKIALTGFCCYSSNPQKNVKFGEYGINEYDLKIAANRVSILSGKGYLPIVSVHAGKEHVNYPSVDTVLAARYLSSISPCIYYGHHPHVVQGIERMNGSLLAYSLGNFCFDDIYQENCNKPFVELSENNRSSIILEVEIKDNVIISYNVIPIYIGKEKISLKENMYNGNLISYTEKLKNVESVEYNEFRSQKIHEFYAVRLSQRNLKWILKRLRPRYAFLMYTNYINKRKYFKCVKSQIKK